MSSNFKTLWTRSENSAWLWVLAFDSRTEQRPCWIFETITSNVSRQSLWLITFNQNQTRLYFSSFGSGFPWYGWSILKNHLNKLTNRRFLRRTTRRDPTNAVYSGGTQTNTTKQLFSQSFQGKWLELVSYCQKSSEPFVTEKTGPGKTRKSNQQTYRVWKFHWIWVPSLLAAQTPVAYDDFHVTRL